MEFTNFISYFFIAIVVVASSGIFLTKNVLYAALLLVFSMLGLAGIYVLLNAEFVAVTQIMIYVGGVLVLVVFAIMLAHNYSGKPLVVENNNLKLGLFTVVLFVGVVGYSISGVHYAVQKEQDGANSVEAIGVQLISRNLLSFELIAVFLLVSLVGAIYFASKIRKT